MSVLLELLSNAASAGHATLPDHNVRLRVTASSESMRITSEIGDLVVEERALVIDPARATVGGDADAFFDVDADVDVDEDDDPRQGAV